MSQTLDGKFSKDELVNITKLKPETRILVKTVNTQYEILVLEPKDRFVSFTSDNPRFPDGEGVLAGASCGIGMLLLGRIIVDLNLEMCGFRTSVVQSFEILQ